MIRHVVVLSFSEGCTREQHAEMLAMLRRLETEVPEVRALAVGPHLTDDGPTPALALVVDVEDREALARYTTNPFHLSVGAFFFPIKGTAAIVDFELGCVATMTVSVLAGGELFDVHSPLHRSLAGAALDGPAVLDTWGRVAYINPAGLAILGRPERDVVGERDELLVALVEHSGRDAPGVLLESDLPGSRRVEYAVTFEAHLAIVAFRDVTDGRRTERQLSAFARTTSSIASAAGLDGVLDVVARHVLEATGIPACTLVLFSPGARGIERTGTARDYPANGQERLEGCLRRGAPDLTGRNYRRTDRVLPSGRSSVGVGHQFSHLRRRASIGRRPQPPARRRSRASFGGRGAPAHRPGPPRLGVAVAILAHVGGPGARAHAREPAGRTPRAGACRAGRDARRGAVDPVRDAAARRAPAAGGGEYEGLVGAVRGLAGAVSQRHEVRIDVTGSLASGCLPDDVEGEVFRVIQEAVNNAARHASAKRIGVRFDNRSVPPGHCSVVVSDDGVGFDPYDSYPGHWGLRAMRERVDRVSGRIEFASVPGDTRVLVTIPVGDLS